MCLIAKTRLVHGLPMSIRAYVQTDMDDNYYIYINELLCDKARKDAFAHEIAHIMRDDFHSGKTLEEIEGYER